MKTQENKTKLTPHLNQMYKITTTKLFFDHVRSLLFTSKENNDISRVLELPTFSFDMTLLQKT